MSFKTELSYSSTELIEKEARTQMPWKLWIVWSAERHEIRRPIRSSDNLRESPFIILKDSTAIGLKVWLNGQYFATPIIQLYSIVEPRTIRSWSTPSRPPLTPGIHDSHKVMERKSRQSRMHQRWRRRKQHRHESETSFSVLSQWPKTSNTSKF